MAVNGLSSLTRSFMYNVHTSIISVLFNLIHFFIEIFLPNQKRPVWALYLRMKGLVVHAYVAANTSLPLEIYGDWVVSCFVASLFWLLIPMSHHNCILCLMSLETFPHRLRAANMLVEFKIIFYAIHLFIGYLRKGIF